MLSNLLITHWQHAKHMCIGKGKELLKSSDAVISHESPARILQKEDAEK